MGSGASKKQPEGGHRAQSLSLEQGAPVLKPPPEILAAAPLEKGPARREPKMARGGGSAPRPKWDEDIVQHAAMLGLRATNLEDDEFMWIAEKAARDLLRPPWVRLIDEVDGRIYYYNGQKKISTFTSPHLVEYKKLLRQRREAKRLAEAALSKRQAEDAEVAAPEDSAGGDDKAADSVRTMSTSGPAVEHMYLESPDQVLIMHPALQQRVTRIVDMPAIWGAVNEKPPGKLALKLNNKQPGRVFFGPAGDEAQQAGEGAASAGSAAQRGSSLMLPGAEDEGGSWWFQARLRCCQIPSVRASIKVVDRVDWENWLGREDNDQTDYNMLTSKVLALDLSINHISSIALGWFAAFPHLRRLDLSLNNLTSLDGIGVAFHLRELNAAQNKLGSYTPPEFQRQMGRRNLIAVSDLAAALNNEAGSKSEEAEGEEHRELKVGGLVANVHENILSKGGLEKLKRLHAIDLSSNLLVSSDIQILFRMSTLTSLALDKNNITSLEGVEQLANLTSLSARHNYIQALTTPLGGHVKGEVRYAPLQGKLHTLHLSHNAMRQVRDVLDAVATHSSASLQHFSIDRNPFGLAEDAARAARGVGDQGPSAVRALGIDLRDVLGDTNEGKGDAAKAYRWTVLLRLPNLVTLDGEEVRAHQRDEAQHIHNHHTLKEAITEAAHGYAETLHALARKKQWSVTALRTQQEQIEEVFTELKRKMEAELHVTINEVANTIKAEERARRREGLKGVITSEVRSRVEGMLDHVQARQEKHLHNYEEHVPLTRVAAPQPAEKVHGIQ